MTSEYAIFEHSCHLWVKYSLAETHHVDASSGSGTAKLCGSWSDSGSDLFSIADIVKNFNKSSYFHTAPERNQKMLFAVSGSATLPNKCMLLTLKNIPLIESTFFIICDGKSFLCKMFLIL
jgi:hypothetical protein